MKIIPFEELYNTEFVISEPLAKGQNWYSRGNVYSCLGKPKPSHTLLWFKNCRGKITDKGGTVVNIEKNQVAYMAKGIEYIVDFFDTAPSQIDSVAFHFQLKGMDNQDIAPTLLPQICIKKVETDTALILDAASDEFNKNVACIPIITSAIYRLLGLACQRQKKRVVSHKYKYISEGIELMENNSDKSLNEIAKICGVSEGYFRKLFREYSGENPIDYRQKMRIEKAKQMLVMDTFTIGEIARELNFTDIYHFSKTFKKYCGVSPGKFTDQLNKID